MDTAGTATTKDWLEATKDMEVKAYDAAEDYALSTGVCQSWQEAMDDIMHRRFGAWLKLAEGDELDDEELSHEDS